MPRPLFKYVDTDGRNYLDDEEYQGPQPVAHVAEVRPAQRSRSTPDTGF